MSKFIIVKEVPSTLEKTEYAIPNFDFRDEIKLCSKKKPRSKAITPNYIREIIAHIGQKYVGEDFDTLSAVNISGVVGTPCNSDSEVHQILINLFHYQCPDVLRKYVTAKFKARPRGTTLIYCACDSRYAMTLIDLGCEETTLKKLDNLKSNKPNKGQQKADNKSAEPTQA